MPPLLVMLMRLSRALTTLLRVLAAPSASALSVRALRLLRLLGPLCTAMLCVLEASPEPLTLLGHGLASLMSLAMLIADTCMSIIVNVVTIYLLELCRAKHVHFERCCKTATAEPISEVFRMREYLLRTAIEWRNSAS